MKTGQSGKPRDLTPRLVLLAAVPSFLVLATVAGITVLFAANERAAQQWVTHTYQAIASLRQILGDAQDAETGSRGYALTGQASFLVPYQQARARVERDLVRFKELTADNPSQQQRADRLAALVKARLASLDETQATSGLRPSPELLQTMQAGKARMDALRNEIAEGTAAEQALLKTRNQAEADQKNYEVLFAVAIAALALAVLLSTALLLVRNNIRLSEAEQARASEAQLLQATLDHIRDGIAYFAADERLSAFNRQFFQLLDLPDALASDGTTLAALASLERDQARPVLVAPSREEAGEPVRINRAGRELEVYRAPVAAGGFLVGVSDVTARVKAENMARQSQKMEAIGHLTGGVAHDFNNLLQIISANLALAGASREVKGNDSVAQRLKNAMIAVSRGSRLISQLLAFARRQPLEPRAVNLGRVIDDIGDLLRHTLGEHTEVEAVVAGGLWNTLADPAQVEATILNLAINARDAMLDGGRITLEVANAVLDDAYAAQNEDVVPGQYVMLAVRDTGAGMAPEILNHVFEPFFTTKPDGKGTGLGLAQAYGFAKQSGGHIKIYSGKGEGTTVKLYLPRTREAEEIAAPDDVQPGQERNEQVLVMEDEPGVRGGVGETLSEARNDAKVLVVEDEPIIRMATVDMIEQIGLRTAEAGNGAEALALIEKDPEIAFLLTDLGLPGMDGHQLAGNARRLRPDLKVIIASGYPAGMSGRGQDVAHLTKPYDIGELRQALALDKGSARPL